MTRSSTVAETVQMISLTLSAVSDWAVRTSSADDWFTRTNAMTCPDKPAQLREITARGDTPCSGPGRRIAFRFKDVFKFNFNGVNHETIGL